MMATPTYDLLDSVTLSSSASSVTFSSIDQSYRDLILAIELKATGSSNVAALLKINSDTGSNYSYVVATGNGSTAVSSSGTLSFGIIQNSSSGTSTIPTHLFVQFLDYSATDKHKPWLSRGNGAGVGTEMIAGRWASTSAITSLTLDKSGTQDFPSGSTFYLYGVAA